MSDLQEIIHNFKEHGYKMTPQRRAILQVLTDGISHPTAEELYNVVKERIPGISLATVYNTLRELVAIQEIQELNLGHGERHYEIQQGEHAHQVCLECGQIQDLPVELEKIKQCLKPTPGFVITRYAVAVYGYCSEHSSGSQGS